MRPTVKIENDDGVRVEPCPADSSIQFASYRDGSFFDYGLFTGPFGIPVQES